MRYLPRSGGTSGWASTILDGGRHHSYYGAIGPELGSRLARGVYVLLILVDQTALSGLIIVARLCMGCYGTGDIDPWE